MTYGNKPITAKMVKPAPAPMHAIFLTVVLFLSSLPSPFCIHMWDSRIDARGNHVEIKKYFKRTFGRT